MDAKVLCENLKARIFTVLGNFPTDFLLIAKGKRVMLVQKRGVHYLNQTIKVIITSNGANWYPVAS